ncbi:MAG TPA: RNA methyltransferase [Acidimicrobiales bacterium]|nr:RNA methyltransferase [Acidimicrobiales bacterium]
MAIVIPVASADDPRLTVYRRLTDADHRRRVEDATGTFVVEGVTAIRRALTSPYSLRSLLLTAPKAQTLAPDLAGVDVDTYVVAQDVMNTVAGFDLHRGAVAVAGRRPLPDPDDVLARARRVAVLEGLNDHENLGAVARSAAALGIDALLLDPTCADPLYRRCVRVSMGEILHLDLARLDPWPDALAAVRAAGFVVVALTPDRSAEAIDAVAEQVAGRRLAIVLGLEARGLSTPALAAAEHRARIPMDGTADSLNVGHAAAIAFHVLR